MKIAVKWMHTSKLNASILRLSAWLYAWGEFMRKDELTAIIEELEGIRDEL